MYFECISGDVSTAWTIVPGDLLYVVPAISFWNIKVTKEATLSPVLDITARGYCSVGLQKYGGLSIEKV